MKARTVLLFLLPLLLLAATVAAGGEEGDPLFLRAKAQGERDGYSVITTLMLRDLLQQDPDVLLVDVRYAYEYEAGHIPGAVSLPVDLRDRTDLSQERRNAYRAALGKDPDRHIVIYCRGFR